MGKHSEDYQKNLQAVEALHKGNNKKAAEILKTTSRENQAAFIRRVKRR